MTLRSALDAATQQLLASPHPERARPDAELLLRAVLDCDRVHILTHSTDELAEPAAERYRSLVAARCSGQPIQYILGYAHFYDLQLAVTPAVLIPRPETELLVEHAIQIASDFQRCHGRPPRILDLCTGSGAIALALRHHLPSASITATDLSPSALFVATSNAARLGLPMRMLGGNLFDVFPATSRAAHDPQPAQCSERFDIIVSNPPYIPTADLASLSVEVAAHEPHLALFAGVDGLDIYRRLIPAARRHLRPGGHLLLEIGHNQSAAIRALLQSHGYHSIHFLDDLQHIPRHACAVCP